MSMMVSSQPNVARNTSAQRTQANDAPAPQKPKTVVDQVVDKTFLSANFTASTLTGGIGGIGGYAREVVPAALKTTASLYSNLWKAETVGPNLKIIGSLVAAPAMAAVAVLGLPVAAITGLYQGAQEVDSSKPRQFTIGPALREGFSEVKGALQEGTQSMQKSLAEFGAEKLEAGEKPIDIPIMKTGKTIAMAAAGAAIGGIAGLVSACVGTVRESVAGIGQAFGDENLNLPGKLVASAGAVLGGAVHGVSYGLATAVSITGRGIGETWDKDSMVQGGKMILNQAANSVSASFAPKATLLQERPTQA